MFVVCLSSFVVVVYQSVRWNVVVCGCTHIKSTAYDIMLTLPGVGGVSCMYMLHSVRHCT